MKRTIIKIAENLCNGCGSCVKSCHEGALQLIDGKARIINETFCDGLGACIGECPQGAIKLEEKEEPSDKCAIPCGCPGSMEMSFKNSSNKEENKKEIDSQLSQSQLSQWPIKLHLVNPQAQYFINTDVVLAADCSAYAFGNFHNQFLKNHSIATACPKLDAGKENYIEKITLMADVSNINTLTVIIMEVPCCKGLLQLAQQAVANASRKIPIKKIVVGIKGDIIIEQWI